MRNIKANCEQQQSVLVATEEGKQTMLQPLRQRTLYTIITEHLWVILLLFIIIGGIGIVYVRCHQLNEEEKTIVQRQEKFVEWEWHRKYGLSRYNSQENSHQQSAWNNVYGRNNSESKQRYRRQASTQQPAPPGNVGYINIYINQPVSNGSHGSIKSFRFPVARYNQGQFPLTGPFVSFIAYVPIVADQPTGQTIIYSSTGVYILPSFIDTYGKLYSVAELIASGYASMMSSGVQPTNSIDMGSFFQSTTTLQLDGPSISASGGGFVGSIQNDFGFLNMNKKPELLVNSRESDEQEQNDINSQALWYMQIRHDRQRSRHTKPIPTQPLPTYKSTTSSTPSTGTTGVNSPREVYQTLIIDEIYPYSKSRKPIISANYSFPGPLLEAYENDTFVIRVINRLNVPTTIHWHGIYQLGTPDMDGAVGITQCAIPPNYEITYKFKATPAGTTWYHGHLLEQYTDGLYGPLIVRRRNEPNQQLYDSEQILMIADWYNNRAHTKLLRWYLNPNNPDGNEPSPDAIVVNGKFTQSLFISLSGSRHVRFRIINTAAFSMYTVSIDGLPLHVIEVDSTATFPYTVNSFNVNVAQRVSFYIDLNELDASYTPTGASATNALFIRIQAVLSMYPVDILNYIPPYEQQRYPYPTFFNPLYVAIMSFDSTNSTPTYPISQQTPTIPNAVTPKDTNLLDARPFDQNRGGIPSATHYLNLVIVFALGPDGINHPYMNNVTYSSDANYMHMRPNPTTGITSDLYAPLLHQMAQKPQQLGIPPPRIQAGSSLPTIQSDQNGHYLVPYQAVVDIFLNNTDGGEHPFHLHGHQFWVIATSDYPKAETLYAGNYMRRDTVSVPALGWVKIRFVADNPGAWFFHCHIEWHMTAGLALAFLVSPQQLLANGYTVSQSQENLCQALQQFNENSGIMV